MKPFGKYLALFALAFGSASSYALPYIKYIFYDALLKGLQINNEQLGLLFTFYAGVHLCLYLPGGWMADRFSIRKILVFSFFGTAALCVWLAASMNYRSAIFVWAMLGFSTGFAYWAATVKGVKRLGSNKEQGKMFGFFESFTGLSMAMILFLALYIFSLFHSAVSSLRAVILFYSLMNLVAALIVSFFYKESDVYEQERKEEQTQVRFVSVLRKPQIWLASLIIFSGYGLFSGETFFTPYLTRVFGVTVGLSAILSIIRTYVLRFMGTPVGGLLSEKTGSSLKVLLFSFSVTGILLLAFFAVSPGTQFIVVLLLMFAASITTYMAFGIMWATVEEIRVPGSMLGMVIGVTSLIGYMPDLFVHTLFGRWLDLYGNAGYRYIFSFLILLCFIGTVSSALFILSLKKNRTARKMQAEQVSHTF